MPQIPSDALMEQIKEAVRYVMRQTRGTEDPQTISPNTHRSMQWAISNVAIGVAANGLTAPSSGEVEILSMDSNNDLSRSGIKPTGVNRSESVAIAKDTLLIVMRLKGERVIVWADCAALASPPA
jgi:hypothetical protein